MKIDLALTALSLLALSAGCPRPCEPSGPVAGQTFTIPGFGTITTLGSFGGTYTWGNALDNSGRVVGSSDLSCPLVWHAFLWQGGALTDLGTLGGDRSRARDINDTGQVVGETSTGRTVREIPVVLGWYSEPEIHAFVWENGTMTGLGTLPGGLTSGAEAVNDGGQVVGWAGLPIETGLRSLGKSSLRATTIAELPTRAVLWEHRDGRWQAVDLGTLGGSQAMANDINNLGQVIGWADTGDSSEDHGPIRRAFLWSAGVMTELGTLGGVYSSAVALNDAGQVVGEADTAEFGQDGQWPRRIAHGTLWQDGEMIDLGTLGGEQSAAVDINEVGQVVGWSETSVVEAVAPYRPTVRHAFLWQEGVMTDLNDLLPADSGWEIRSAHAINDSRQIVGKALRYFGPDPASASYGEIHSILITLAP